MKKRLFSVNIKRILTVFVVSTFVINVLSSSFLSFAAESNNQFDKQSIIFSDLQSVMPVLQELDVKDVSSNDLEMVLKNEYDVIKNVADKASALKDNINVINSLNNNNFAVEQVSLNEAVKKVNQQYSRLKNYVYENIVDSIIDQSGLYMDVSLIDSDVGQVLLNVVLDEIMSIDDIMPLNYMLNDSNNAYAISKVDEVAQLIASKMKNLQSNQSNINNISEVLDKNSAVFDDIRESLNKLEKNARVYATAERVVQKAVHNIYSDEEEDDSDDDQEEDESNNEEEDESDNDEEVKSNINKNKPKPKKEISVGPYETTKTLLTQSLERNIDDEDLTDDELLDQISNSEEMVNAVENVLEEAEQIKDNALARNTSDVDDKLLKQELSSLQEKFNQQIQVISTQVKEEINNEEQELSNKEQELSNKEQELSNKEQELSNKEQELSNKEQELSNKEQELSNKEQELSNKEQELSNKEQELSNKEQELLQDVRIKELEAQLDLLLLQIKSNNDEKVKDVIEDVVAESKDEDVIKQSENNMDISDTSNSTDINEDVETPNIDDRSTQVVEQDITTPLPAPPLPAALQNKINDIKNNAQASQVVKQDTPLPDSQNKVNDVENDKQTTQVVEQSTSIPTPPPLPDSQNKVNNVENDKQTAQVVKQQDTSIPPPPPLPTNVSVAKQIQDVDSKKVESNNSVKETGVDTDTETTSVNDVNNSENKTNESESTSKSLAEQLNEKRMNLKKTDTDTAATSVHNVEEDYGGNKALANEQKDLTQMLREAMELRRADLVDDDEDEEDDEDPWNDDREILYNDNDVPREDLKEFADEEDIINYLKERSMIIFNDTYLSAEKVNDDELKQDMFLKIQNINKVDDVKEIVRLSNEAIKVEADNLGRYYPYWSAGNFVKKYLSEEFINSNNSDVNNLKRLCIIAYLHAKYAMDSDFDVDDILNVKDTAKTIKGLAKKLHQDGYIESEDLFDDIIYQDMSINKELVYNLSKVAATMALVDVDENNVTHQKMMIDEIKDVPVDNVEKLSDWNEVLDGYQKILGA